MLRAPSMTTETSYDIQPLHSRTFHLLTFLRYARVSFRPCDIPQQPAFGSRREINTTLDIIAEMSDDAKEDITVTKMEKTT